MDFKVKMAIIWHKIGKIAIQFCTQFWFRPGKMNPATIIGLISQLNNWLGIQKEIFDVITEAYKLGQKRKINYANNY